MYVPVYVYWGGGGRGAINPYGHVLNEMLTRHFPVPAAVLGTGTLSYRGNSDMISALKELTATSNS